MKLYDVGKKQKMYADVPAETKKEKIWYPELRIEKYIGDFDVGDTVTLLAQAKVTAMRSDENGETITFQIRKLGVKEGMTSREKVAKAVDKIDIKY